MPFTNSNGCRIYWEESGAGDPLLLIMGLGYSHDMWHRTRPAMADHYQTIVFDNRGVGKSDLPAGPYSIAQMADDAAAVLDAAGVERAHVYGISMGGMIAQELALNHPERVRSLILGCTACGGAKAVPTAAPVMQTLLDRAAMTPEEGVEAMGPVHLQRVYAARPHRRGPRDPPKNVPGGGGVLGADPGNPWMEFFRPAPRHSRPDAGAPRRGGSVGASGERTHSRPENFGRSNEAV